MHTQAYSMKYKHESTNINHSSSILEVWDIKVQIKVHDHARIPETLSIFPSFQNQNCNWASTDSLSCPFLW